MYSAIGLGRILHRSIYEYIDSPIIPMTAQWLFPTERNIVDKAELYDILNANNNRQLCATIIQEVVFISTNTI